jgi:hypothetical protein
VFEDKTPFLEIESGFFVLGIGKLDRWQKKDLTPSFS